MREEIGLIVSGLLGRLRKVVAHNQLMKLGEAEILIFREGQTEWKVWTLLTDKIAIECRRLEKGDSRFVLSTQIRDAENEVALADVEFAHESLQILVDGLFERFPQLREDAEIVRRAAAKFPVSHN